MEQTPKEAVATDESELDHLGGAGGKEATKPFMHRVIFDEPESFLNYMGCMLPYPWYKTLAEVESFEAKTGDVCLISFPRAGRSWMSAIVAMILNDGNPDCLHSKTQPLTQLVPFLEECLPPAIDHPELRTIHKIKAAPSPRLYATHLPVKALPISIFQKAKIIYTYRNPKDVLVSLHNFMRGIKAVGYQHDLPYLADQMTRDHGKIWFGPFFDHIEGYWQQRHLESLLVCSYEELKQNMPREVTRIVAFLGKTLTAEQVERICHECSFHTMKDNPTVNRQEMQDKYGVMDFKVSPYMKGGKSGSWKSAIDDESNRKLDHWIAEHLAKPELKGLEFQFM
ncbi:putative Sulfotransferase family cytosolic 1B member 1 [Hypsibius exemplaris]|uniref:Sulfotransferase family cytosolic 1B member 1 n=1 Tax=Hypsibius exemplaris TaxID=2072580 RepID=A0A1W0WYP9_HYPEX|nr:putative Sulfotransferase family cytosolic 1B member 1 [Hypsibius exemplaris]